MGRPSIQTPELCASICERIALGESLVKITNDEGMPAQSTVYLWLSQDSAFSENYARAREVQADSFFDEIVAIADDGTNDWMERHGKEDAGWVANGEHIKRSRLRVDARKWAASKLAPKKYGDSTLLKHGDPDGKALSATVNVVIAGA